MRRLWLQIIHTSGARIYWLLVGLIIASVTARVLGPAGRGIYAAATSWVVTFYTISYMSLAQVVMFVATGRKKEEWLPEVLGALSAALTALTVLSWSAAAVGYIATGGELFNNLGAKILVLAFLSLPFMLWVENANAILVALGAINVVNIAQVVGATLSLAAVVLFVVLVPFGVEGALAGFLVNHATVAAIGLTYVIRHAPAARFDFRVLRTLLGGGLKLHMNAVANVLILQSAVLVLNHIRTPEETAYYQIAAQLIAAVQTLPIAANMVVYSVVTRDGPDAAWPQQRRILVQAVGVIASAAVVLYFAAPLVVTAVGGAEFAPAIPVFRILLLSTVPMALSIIMASQWVARGLFLQVSAISLVAAVFSLAGNLFIVPRYGMIGAAGVTVATYTLGVTVNVWMAFWVERRWRRWAADQTSVEPAP